MPGAITKSKSKRRFKWPEVRTYLVLIVRHVIYHVVYTVFEKGNGAIAFPVGADPVLASAFWQGSLIRSNVRRRHLKFISNLNIQSA